MDERGTNIGLFILFCALVLFMSLGIGAEPLYWFFVIAVVISMTFVCFCAGGKKEPEESEQSQEEQTTNSQSNL